MSVEPLVDVPGRIGLRLCRSIWQARVFREPAEHVHQLDLFNLAQDGQAVELRLHAPQRRTREDRGVVNDLFPLSDLTIIRHQGLAYTELHIILILEEAEEQVPRALNGEQPTLRLGKLWGVSDGNLWRLVVDVESAARSDNVHGREQLSLLDGADVLPHSGNQSLERPVRLVKGVPERNLHRQRVGKLANTGGHLLGAAAEADRQHLVSAELRPRLVDDKQAYQRSSYAEPRGLEQLAPNIEFLAGALDVEPIQQ